MADYGLAPVREQRQRDERTSRGELADTIACAAASESALATADARIDTARRRLDDARRASDGAAGRLAITDRYLARLRHDLERAYSERARLASSHRERQQDVERAQGRFAWARAQREIIERHFARWRDQQRKRAERRAD